MAIRSKADLFDWLRELRAPFWSLYTGAKASKLASTKDSDAISMDDSLDYLDKQLRIHGPGRYVIQAAQGNTEAFAKKQFEQSIELSEISGANMPQAPANKSLDDVEGLVAKRVAEAIQRYQVEQELSNLRVENADLKRQLREMQPSDLDRAAGKFLTALAPYAPNIAGAFLGELPAAPAISGPGDHPVPDDQALEQFTLDCEILNATIHDFPGVIHKLATIAQRNPAALTSILPMLDNLL